jgi:hypothetical protein
MAAVTTFVSRRPKPREAIKFGIQWAVGHGFSLLLLGSLLFALKVTINESLAGSLEKFVGFALLLLGLWTLYQLRFGSFHHLSEQSHDHAGHTHEHPHVHSHDDKEALAHSLSHRHGSLWMGVLHGAAGTAAFVGEAFVVVSHSYWAVLTYTVVYSLGVLVAMACYAGALGGLIDWGGHKFRATLVGAQALAGALACVVGVCWITGIEIPWIHFPSGSHSP